MACIYDGAPPLNTDIAGIGVRVSFYLQTLCLSVISALSTKHKERKGALYVLWLTNTAMAISALVVGLKHNPEISFQDALVVLYLMRLSSICSAFAAALSNWVKDWPHFFFSITRAYMCSVFMWIVLTKRKSFGSFPECNTHAVFAYFYPVRALTAGWILWLIPNLIGDIAYTYLTVSRIIFFLNNDNDLVEDVDLLRPHLLMWKSRMRRNLFFWGIEVANTELLIRWNHFAPLDGPTWQFGQILPLILVVLPLSDTFSVIRKFVSILDEDDISTDSSDSESE